MDINPYQSPASVESESPLVANFAIAHGCCDLCGGKDFKEWEWWHPVMLHWVLNPGVAINELLLGQRVPSRVLTCRVCYQNFWTASKVQYTRCDNCHGLHRIEIWGDATSFGNWAGLVCPDCGAYVPCLHNLTAALLIVPLTPLWWPIYHFWRLRLRAWSRSKSERGRASSYARRPPLAVMTSNSIQPGPAS